MFSLGNSSWHLSLNLFSLLNSDLVPKGRNEAKQNKQAEEAKG
jgi:hypothetical protein